MAREWYVFKVGKREDTTRSGRIAQAPGQEGAVPRAVRRDQRARDAWPLDNNQVGVGPAAAAEPVPAAGDPSYGFEIHREDRNPNIAFNGLEAAQRYAVDQAQLNPKTLFGVFECIQVFETTKPSVLEKKYNDAGELVVREAT